MADAPSTQVMCFSLSLRLRTGCAATLAGKPCAEVLHAAHLVILVCAVGIAGRLRFLRTATCSKRPHFKNTWVHTHTGREKMRATPPKQPSPPSASVSSPSPPSCPDVLAATCSSTSPQRLHNIATSQCEEHGGSAVAALWLQNRLSTLTIPVLVSARALRSRSASRSSSRISALCSGRCRLLKLWAVSDHF